MGTTPPAPLPRHPSRVEEFPASPPRATRLIALVGTWLVLGLGTPHGNRLVPGAIWSALTTRTRHRPD